MTSALHIKNVYKTFCSQKHEVTALSNINVEINEGDLFCILGPSGCGKTTLLRCIAGFEKLTEGEILVGDHKVSKPGPDRTMVFQSFDQLLSWKTVLANVEFPLRVNKTAPRKEIRDTARQFLSVVGLGDFVEHYPHELSGGMKQRVAIARALALRPRVLLMDEPFASLDAQTRTALQNELISIWDKFKTTIVFITHNIEEAVILGNRIAVMSKRPGKIKKILANDLERPRAMGAAGFEQMWNELHTLLETD